MRPKDHLPNINEPIKIFGIEFLELAVLTGIFTLVLMGVGIINTFIPLVNSWFFTFLGVGYIGSVLLLRFSNRQGERGFLTSLISYYFFQPKHIRHYGKGR